MQNVDVCGSYKAHPYAPLTSVTVVDSLWVSEGKGEKKRYKFKIVQKHGTKNVYSNRLSYHRLPSMERNGPLCLSIQT